MSKAGIATLDYPLDNRSAHLDDDALFEEVDGVRVDLPPMSAYAEQLSNRLVQKINFFADPKDLGQGLVEILFALPAPVNRNRRPDGAFLSYQRWAKNRRTSDEGNAWPVVPELAIEVVSPYDLAEDLDEKIREYFLAGVKLVWVVYPKADKIVVLESTTAIKVVHKHDLLDGGAVLPGFQLPLKELFLEG